jgi:hypothetical protein
MGILVHPVCMRSRYEQLIRSETDTTIASSSHQPCIHGTSFLLDFRILRSPPTPGLAHNVVMTCAPTSNVRTLESYRLDYDARIKAAIDDLASQDHPNVTATAAKWKIVRETLSKRFRGETIVTKL